MRVAAISPAKEGGRDTAAAPPELRRVAEEFEAVLVGQLLHGLTAGLTGPGEAGNENDPFASMLQDEYAKLISRRGGIGISAAVLRQLLHVQEGR